MVHAPEQYFRVVVLQLGREFQPRAFHFDDQSLEDGFGNGIAAPRSHRADGFLGVLTMRQPRRRGSTVATVSTPAH